MAPRLARRAAPLAAAVVPVGVAAAWVPLRDRLPNTDIALVLVLAIAATGFLWGRLASALAAGTAGAAFDLLHTRPYGALSISRGHDVLTAAFLVVAGLLVGQGAAGAAGYRRRASGRADAFSVVMEASTMVATGDPSGVVTEALAEEIRVGLGMRECRFLPRPPTGQHPCVARDGGLVRLELADASAPVTEIDLPVWSRGEVVACYRMVLGPGASLDRDRLRVALSLADQAGAALAEAEPEAAPEAGPHQPEPPGPVGPPRLRPVR